MDALPAGQYGPIAKRCSVLAAALFFSVHARKPKARPDFAPAGEVRVYINGVAVTTSTERRHDFVLDAAFPEAPIKNEITLQLVDPSSDRAIDQVPTPQTAAPHAHACDNLSTLDSQPSICNRKPSTLNPKPGTRNPKPGTRNPEALLK